MADEFTGLAHPVQHYPYRLCLDLIEAIRDYTTGRSVCDLGCGCGDLVYELKQRGHCSAIVGVESNLLYRQQIASVHADRDFIVWGDISEVDLPEADVYYTWIVNEGIRTKLNELGVEKTIIDGVVPSNDAPGFQPYFDSNPGFQLVETIRYEFDERKSLATNDDRVFVEKGGKQWPTFGERVVRVYTKIA